MRISHRDSSDNADSKLSEMRPVRIGATLKMLRCGDAGFRTIDFLSERRNSAKGHDEIHLYDDLLHQYEHKIAAIDLCGPGGSVPPPSEESLSMEGLLLDTVRRQRDELNSLRENGRVGDAVHRSLERELDLSESRLT